MDEVPGQGSEADVVAGEQDEVGGEGIDAGDDTADEGGLGEFVVVDVGELRDAEGEIAILAARMGVLPMIGEQARQGDAPMREPVEVAIENGEFGQQNQKPHVGTELSAKNRPFEPLSMKLVL